MNPTVAISVKDTSERKSAFDRDFPHLASHKSDMDRIFENMGIFAELDKHYRFQLMDSRDAAGNPEIFDHKTGALIQLPQPNDPPGEKRFPTYVTYVLAYDEALKHRDAVWELERNLRDEVAEAKHREFDKLMRYAGYVRDEHGELQPTEAKLKELLQRGHPLDSLYGKGWLDKK